MEQCTGSVPGSPVSLWAKVNTIWEGVHRVPPPASSGFCTDTEVHSSDTEMSKWVEIQIRRQTPEMGGIVVSIYYNHMIVPKRNNGPESLSDLLLVKEQRNKVGAGRHESVLLTPTPPTQNSLSSLKKTNTTVLPFSPKKPKVQVCKCQKMTLNIQKC